MNRLSQYPKGAGGLSDRIQVLQPSRIAGLGLLPFLLLICSLGPLQTGHCQQGEIYTTLKEQFDEPPAYAWPRTYWWWLNGNIDTVRIREEIRAMAAAGLSGFDIFEIGASRHDKRMPTGEIEFMGDEFLKCVKVALDEAQRHGLEAGFNMASSWNAGGAWITPEYSAKSIYFSKVPYTKKGMEVPYPILVRGELEGKIKLGEDQQEVIIERDADGKPVFSREIAVLAIPQGIREGALRPEQVIDVSEDFNPKTGRLNWKTSGKYDIYRFVCSNSGEYLKIPSKASAGPIIDHFDARATEFHFNYIINRLKTILGEDVSDSPLNSLYLASYEALGTVWTTSLPAKFEELHGYSITKYLPLIFNKKLFTAEVYDKVKRDLQYTLSELMIDNFYRKAKEIANANGLEINSESGGPGFPLHNVPVEPLKSLGVMDRPRGEFWIHHNRLNNEGIDILRVVKEVSAASHIYQRGVVEMEAFTTFKHWQEGPAEMKPVGDRAFCEGMNKVVVHGSSHNPAGLGDPGIVYYAGTHYNDKRIWWPMVRPFNQYLARISNVLQQTDFTADVLYFYGSAVPNFAGHKNGRFFPGPGYDYEVTNTEILLQATVENGLITLPNGATFKLLALEPEKVMDPAVFVKIRELAQQGATILSEKPTGFIPREASISAPISTGEIEKLWLAGDASPAKAMQTSGKVFSGITPFEALQAMGIAPDFSYPDQAFSILDYIHYQKQGVDYYLVRNTTDQWVSRRCSFRQSGKQPEWWDPVSGQITPITVFQSEDEITQLPLSLPPHGSAIIAFSAGKTQAVFSDINPDDLNPPIMEYTKDGMLFWEPGRFTLEKINATALQGTNYTREQVLKGAWEVFFQEGKGAPERAIFPELISWSDAEEEGIRYFSGIANYVKTFQFDINSSTAPNQRIYLDLGALSHVADVTLNGVHLGVSWTAPYRLDITDVLQAGDNRLEIAVANTWNNRLKGDAVTGEEYTWTNPESTDIAGLNKIDVPWKDVPLLKSGLLGPVKIVSVRTVNGGR